MAIISCLWVMRETLGTSCSVSQILNFHTQIHFISSDTVCLTSFYLANVYIVHFEAALAIICMTKDGVCMLCSIQHLYSARKAVFVQQVWNWASPHKILKELVNVSLCDDHTLQTHWAVEMKHQADLIDMNDVGVLIKSR